MTAWHELVVEGAERTLRAFVAGFLAGRGEQAGGVFGSDMALAAGSLGERLKALFAAGSHQIFLAPEPLAVPLARALGERGRELGLVVERRRQVESAKFSLRAEAFSRDVAAQIRDALLTALPAGVRVEQRSEKEETHPEAHGPEPFAPLHEYTYRVSGDIVGPFEGVLEVWQRARTLECVETSALHLEGKILSA
jgi:hypothetical protein